MIIRELSIPFLPCKSSLCEVSQVGAQLRQSLDDLKVTLCMSRSKKAFLWNERLSVQEPLWGVFLPRITIDVA
jgi:hypothetical protein